MVVKDNPMGAVYVATLPATAAFKDAYPMGGGPKGEIRAMASPNGMGVMFNVTFSKLPPKELGPFSALLPFAVYLDTTNQAKIAPSIPSAR